MLPNSQAPILNPPSSNSLFNPQASVFQPSNSKPISRKHMSFQAPSELELTQDGVWQLHHGSNDPKDTDESSQASSSTLVRPIRNSNKNRIKPAVPPIVTTAKAQIQTQAHHLVHHPYVQDDSSVYTRAHASAQAHANTYYQAYMQNNLQPPLPYHAQTELQSQNQSHLPILVQITLSDGTVYMLPSHHTFWCYEYDGTYTTRTLASIMLRAEAGSWPGYWLRGQAEMAGALVFVRT